MYEYKVQEAWEEYQKDFGLGRIVLFICFYNTFLFFLGGFFFGAFKLISLLPIGVAIIFYTLRKKVISSSSFILMLANIIPMTLTIIFNYYLVGEYDTMIGGLTRVDQTFVNFDNWLYGKPIALVFESLLANTGLLATILYDMMMVGYFIYFLLPVYGGILWYQMLPDHKRYKLGRYFSSVIIYYSLNYLFYMSIPVTGPQFYISEVFSNPLPLSSFGLFLHSVIANGQTTFIDCFPSGHSGIAILVTIWMYKINHDHRYFVTFITLLIMCATLAIRYHYTLDLLAAFPLAYVSYKLGWLLFPIEVHVRHFRRDNR